MGLQYGLCMKFASYLSQRETDKEKGSLKRMSFGRPIYAIPRQALGGSKSAKRLGCEIVSSTGSKVVSGVGLEQAVRLAVQWHEAFLPRIGKEY